MQIKSYKMFKYKKRVENWCANELKHTTPYGGARHEQTILIFPFFPPDNIKPSAGHHREPCGEAYEGRLRATRRQEAADVHGWLQHARQGHIRLPAPLELIKLWLDYGFWYDRLKQTQKYIKVNYTPTTEILSLIMLILKTWKSERNLNFIVSKMLSFISINKFNKDNHVTI